MNVDKFSKQNDEQLERLKSAPRPSVKAQTQAYRDRGQYAQASAAARKRKKKHRTFAAVAAVVAVVLVVGVAGAFAAGGASPFSAPAPSDQQDAAQGADDGQQDAADQNGQDGTDGSDGSDASSGSDSSGDDPSTWDLSSDPRNADYAVDPNKQTDWRTKTDGTKTIYLTFDDGPSPLTQQVLDILDQYGVKATFFVTNEDPSYAYMIKKCYADGNTIGLHSYTHDYKTVYASEDAFFNDLDQIGQVVKDQIGYVPCFIRFPGGSSNTVSKKYCPGIMTALTADVQARGYQYFDWNISCGDGEHGHTSDQLAAAACDGGDYTNIMLLMHDGGGHEDTVKALPAIIEHYQSLGYTFKAIDRTALASHHAVNN